ncbi:hypothetical protein E4U60_005524 [Claviceps pazoutovae]|uniref:Inositol polyphosphate-related phosphatase domain-containing protein n=1 Tax=Claviceps pazoutovae TaxID=1649127 RepID=A0A9P7MGC3_9HYPO|nr:hypothetical protein E4U60_005524 [Claviceps pazoutovae]
MVEGEKIGDEDFAFWFGDLNFRLDSLPGGDDSRRILTLHTRSVHGPSNERQGTTSPRPIEEEDVLAMSKAENDADTTLKHQAIRK